MELKQKIEVSISTNGTLDNASSQNSIKVETLDEDFIKIQENTNETYQQKVNDTKMLNR